MKTRKIYRLSQFIERKGWTFQKNVSNQSKLWTQIAANGVPLYIIPQVITQNNTIQLGISPEIYMSNKHELKKINSYATLNQYFHRQSILILACPDGPAYVYFMVELQYVQ